ncbi:GtrA family protein [Hoeflea poritis]|uniref:GtrA family protein n=1 Tax=Hoeflea poritis TaxID=2993659 RepID=UPI0022F00C39|nr:GtrA family protein [Hoeflea poritis]
MEFALFVLNGLFATGVHFASLSFLVEIADLRPVGIANFFAACIGIGCSFTGNRYLVFRDRQKESFLEELGRFLALYFAIAVVSATVLFVWTDLGNRSYHHGFLIASAIQFLLSYLGNRYLVFNKR